MNLIIPVFVFYFLLLIYIYIKSPEKLFFVLPFAYLIMPSMRILLGNTPIYCSDIAAIFIFVAMQRKYGVRWLNTKNDPKWHYWFIFSICIGIYVAMARFSLFLEPIYEGFRSSPCFLCYALGVFIFQDKDFHKERNYLGMGITASLLIILALVIYQFGNTANNTAVASFFYSNFSEDTVNTHLASKARLYRPSATFQAPTTLAGMVLMSAGCAWLCLQNSYPVVARLAVMVGVLSSIFTLSRQGILSIAIAAPFFILASNEKNPLKRLNLILLKVIITVFVVILFFSLIGSTEFGQILGDRLSRGGVEDDYNLSARLIDGPIKLYDVIKNDLSILLWGIGVGIQKARFIQDADLINNLGFVSNSFLLPLLYTGVFGFLSLIIFWIWNLVIAFKLRNNLRLPAMGIVLMTIILLLSDNYGYLTKSAVMMWSLIGGCINGIYSFQRNLDKK